MKNLLLLFFINIIFLSGCASMTTGTQQSLSVRTTACPGASCQLKNSKGLWYVNSTPGSVSVHRAYGDMTVTCQKQGYSDVTDTVPSSTKGMAATNVIWGVFIPVGVAVDAGTGAAYDYPSEIVMKMSCQ